MWIDRTRWARNIWAMAAIFVLTMTVIADMVRRAEHLLFLFFCFYSLTRMMFKRMQLLAVKVLCDSKQLVGVHCLNHLSKAGF